MEKIMISIMPKKTCENFIINFCKKNHLPMIDLSNGTPNGFVNMNNNKFTRHGGSVAYLPIQNIFNKKGYWKDLHFEFIIDKGNNNYVNLCFHIEGPKKSNPFKAYCDKIENAAQKNPMLVVLKRSHKSNEFFRIDYTKHINEIPSNKSAEQHIKDCYFEFTKIINDILADVLR